MKLIADASLPLLSDLFSSQFQLSTYRDEQELRSKLFDQDILLCRSTLKIDESLLNGSLIQCVATASSGTDHMDFSYLRQQNIHALSAKGCNAPSVADYVTATVAYLQEEGLLKGGKAGVIGIGEVGRRVVKRLKAMGFEVFCYDPLKALADSTFHSCSFEALQQCDLITLHANLHNKEPFASQNLLNADYFSKSINQVIINASRGGIVNEAALLTAKNKITYCTDVFQDEPAINPAIIRYATVCTPHIAGHSIEAKKMAVRMISEQLHRLYGLHASTIFREDEGNLSLSPLATWQKTVLFLYNPITETILLKQNPESFKSLRKAHDKRHDFTRFESSLLTFQMKQLLGFEI